MLQLNIRYFSGANIRNVNNCHQWRTQKIIMWGWFIKWYMYGVICIWCALFVTS